MLPIGYYALLLCILGEPVPDSDERYYPEPEEALRYILGRERMEIVISKMPKRIIISSPIEEHEPVQLCLELEF